MSAPTWSYAAAEKFAAVFGPCTTPSEVLDEGGAEFHQYAMERCITARDEGRVRDVSEAFAACCDVLGVVQ